MMHVENKYRVERLEVKTYLNSWGVIDLDKKVIALENLFNDMFEKGYIFDKFLPTKDNMGVEADFYVFKKQ